MTAVRILIVEDETIVAHNVAGRLRELGYTVPAMVTTGEEAMQRAAELRPDLVLMDIRLQGAMDGVAAAGEIRARLDIPVVYLTGYADQATLTRAKITEPFGYVLKPFEVRELQSTIEMALYKHAMDQRLRESERKYRSLVETLQEGIWTLDAEARTTYVNPRMAEMLGYTADEMQGRHLFAFMDEAHTALAQRCLERRAQGVAEQHEFTFRHKDGSPVHVLIETTPITDKEGRYSGAIAGVVNITGRVQAEERLRLLSAALEASANAIVIADAAGTIVWTNAAFTRLTGYAVSEAIGQNPRVLKSGAHHAEFYAYMWETITAGRVWHGEVINRRKDGTLYTEEMTITPVRKEQGAITHYIAVKQDITARKQAEEEVRRAKEAAEAANRAKSTFLTNMGHEFRTPLNAILGYSELLEEDLASLGEAGYVADLQRIRQAGRQLLALVNDILALSKIEAGRMVLQQETFDVAGLVAEVAQAIAQQAEGQDNTLTVQCADDVGTMHTDRQKLAQVLLNLGSNAAKFTQAGQITLSAAREPGGDSDRVVFHIADTGVGIAPEKISELFTPFNQADPSATRRFGGTGLGLALSRRLCDLLGGEISAESKVGKGSVFTVRLPVSVIGAR